MAVGAKKERTKVVVRRLPPGLTEEAFKSTIDKLVEGKYSWLSYWQGKVSQRKVVFSRAYLNFIEPEYVYEFKDKFHGHVFVSTKGNQYKVSVEYAPFQKVPSREKKNPLEGTIEQDPDYQAFVKTLEEGPALLPSAVVQREQAEREAAVAKAAEQEVGKRITPLMEYLQNKYLNNQGGLRGRKKAAGKEDAGTGKERGKRDGRRGEEGADARGSGRAARDAEGRERGRRDKGGREQQDQPAPKVLIRPKDATTAAAAAAAVAGASGSHRPASAAAEKPHGNRGDRERQPREAREPKEGGRQPRGEGKEGGRGQGEKHEKEGRERRQPQEKEGGKGQRGGRQGATEGQAEAGHGRPASGRHNAHNAHAQQEAGSSQAHPKQQHPKQHHKAGDAAEPAAGTAAEGRQGGRHPRGQAGEGGASGKGHARNAAHAAGSSAAAPAEHAAPKANAHAEAVPKHAPKVLTRPASAAAPPASQDAGGSSSQGGGDAGAANPSRKVRVGFQAYRPPTGRRGGDAENG